MINKENISTGKSTVNISMHGGEFIVVMENTYLVCDSITNKDEAELIAEAFNVFSETGMTPEELKKELLGANLMVEQVQQERDELIKLQKENFGDATTTHLKLSKYVKSLTTQQEEKKDEQ